MLSTLQGKVNPRPGAIRWHAGKLYGTVDEVVLKRVLQYVNVTPGTVYGGAGKAGLLKSLSGYNRAARFAPWVVLIDLDADAGYAPQAMREWLPAPARYMCFRVVVFAVEAWLLADRVQLARFLSIPVSRIPPEPENLQNPKRILIDLARQSRRQAIRVDMVPRPGSNPG